MNEAANIIERFIAGIASDYEWDDFVSVTTKDDTLNRVKEYCTSIDFLFPSESADGKPYFSKSAWHKLGQLKECLEISEPATDAWLTREGF